MSTRRNAPVAVPEPAPCPQRPALRLGCYNLELKAVEEANDAWGMNCGPAALCAITGLSPEAIRPFLGDFEAKRYTNPTLMRETLDRLGVRYRKVARWVGRRPPSVRELPTENSVGYRLSIYRVQWGGPWCAPGVPPVASYVHTHWVAAQHLPYPGGVVVFDCDNPDDANQGEIPWVTWLGWHSVREEHIRSIPRSNGTWWFTHAFEVETP